MATFFAGKNGRATFGGVNYYGTKWTAEIETGEIDVTNFESPTSLSTTWREFLGGFTKGLINISAIHDPTLAQPTDGASATYTLKVGSTYTVTGSGVLLKRTYGQDIEGKATVDFQIRMTGAPSFT